MGESAVQNRGRTAPLLLIVVSAVGLSLFQASAWVVFLAPVLLTEIAANHFIASSPFFLSLLGQAVATMLLLLRALKGRLLAAISHPAALLLCALVAGMGAISLAASGSPAVGLAGAAIMGFAGMPILLAWGTFFSGQQPHYAAAAIALSFILNCLVGNLFPLVGGIGSVAANLLLPVLSVTVWLLCIKRFEPVEKGEQHSIREYFDDGYNKGAAQPSHRQGSLSALLASTRLLVGHNRSLLLFLSSIFFVYLLEQLLQPLSPGSEAVFSLTIAIALILFFIFGMYALAGNRSNPDFLWPLFILLVFAALFATALFWGTVPTGVLDFTIVVSRSMQNLTWIILVTTISRHSLEPFRAFGLGYLLSQQLPWLLSFVLALAVMVAFPGYGVYMELVAGGLAFLLLVAFTLVFALFYTKDQSRSLAPDQSQRGGSQVALQEAGVGDVGLLSLYERSLVNIAALANLTTRETEIVKLIIQGRTLPEIAEKYVLSINTVRTHYRHAYQKLDIHKRSELIDLFEREQSHPQGGTE